MKGKDPDTAMGGGISGDYTFVDEIVLADMQGMVHGRLFIFTGKMNFIHIEDHEFFYGHPL